MSIKDLYNSPEYNDVLFYFSERGFSKLEDLAAFDFDELYFVPGLSEETIEAAKELFRSAKDSPDEPCVEIENHECAPKDLAEDLVTKEALSQEIEACCEAMQQAIGSIASIEELDAKRKVIQRAGNDRIDTPSLFAVCDEIESFFQVRKEMAQEAEQKEKEALIALLERYPVESVFREVSRGSAMLSYCKKNNISTLAQLIDFDFENTKVHGLGKSSMEACKTAFQQTVKALLSSQEDNPHAAANKNSDQMDAEVIDPLQEQTGLFRNAFYSLDARARESLLRKARGETLQ